MFHGWRQVLFSNQRSDVSGHSKNSGESCHSSYAKESKIYVLLPYYPFNVNKDLCYVKEDIKGKNEIDYDDIVYTGYEIEVI